MKFNLEKSSGVRIHAYDPGIITLTLPASLDFPRGAEAVTDEPSLCRVSSNLIISSAAIHQDECPACYEELSEQHIEFAMDFNPEIILLGTGNTIQFPAPKIMSIPAKQGVGLEVMDTGAACRTYNVLVGENRQVVAILLLN